MDEVWKVATPVTSLIAKHLSGKQQNRLQRGNKLATKGRYSLILPSIANAPGAPSGGEEASLRAHRLGGQGLSALP